MFDRYFHIQHLSWVCLIIQNVLTHTDQFICPKDGGWPHPSDCEKYYTCTGSTAAEGWCGHGMTYDVDHERCELSKSIDCKNGERPNWSPPEGWLTARITERSINPTTVTVLTDPITTEQKPRTTLKLTTIIATQLAHSRMLLPAMNLIENTPCIFQENMPDAENCQSYFICKDDMITRLHCPDKHLFDEDLRSCNDYRKVFCGNRPSHEHRNDPCLGQPNGWYPDIGKQCRSYYLCTEQRTTKTGDCPIGSKWNVYRLRCDDPRYLAAPCGLRSNQASSLLGCKDRDCALAFLLASFIVFAV